MRRGMVDRSGGLEQGGRLSALLKGKLPLVGILIGVVLTIAVSVGYQLAGSSRFCGACHSMTDVADRWGLSKHKQFACVECHMPDAGMVERVTYKAQAGFRDLLHETLRDYPAMIRLSARGERIINENCLRCHYSTVERTGMSKGGQSCAKCHRRLIHGTGLARGGLSNE
ncbi:MAG: Cytochrome c-type protein NrfH [Syntrophorhabdus sp. PtaU1.Bin050]|nr:MAG: Cytochrome c-type protein NrfH [Syntrophorhabdus sp. PtaU1.Bin050]